MSSDHLSPDTELGRIATERCLIKFEGAWPELVGGPSDGKRINFPTDASGVNVARPVPVLMASYARYGDGPVRPDPIESVRYEARRVQYTASRYVDLDLSTFERYVYHAARWATYEIETYTIIRSVFVSEGMADPSGCSRYFLPAEIRAMDMWAMSAVSA